MALQNYVGKGIIFPIELTSGGFPVIRTGLDLIRSSIKMILSWPLGQRFFLNQFGSRLEEVLEEPNDDLLRGLINYFIFDSLRSWEKRIDIIETEISRTEPDKLEVLVVYRIKNSDLEDIFTFPFYRKITT